MKLAVIDNYDSFTFNLVHYLEVLCNEIVVVRNDQINYEILDSADAIVLSPGPGLPQESGELMLLISKYIQHKPILGVCLGLQAVVLHFGGELKNLSKVKHGIQSICLLNSPNEHSIFAKMQDKIAVGHYHSWVVNEKLLPKDLLITAKNEEGLVMAIKHKSLPISALQFHPESVLTPDGKMILANWVNSIKQKL